VAESDRFPELGRAFYEAGPKLGQDRMMAYFAAAQARGELRITDPEMAADQFSELCKATLWPQAVFGIRSRFPDAEIRHVAKEAVLTFLARYGA
jgi:TetR/AcrR family transcriptional repressor of mexJK operon